MEENKRVITPIEKISEAVTRGIGTPKSIIIHTLCFGGIFLLYFFGFKFDQIMLILTTAVSLEAIYLSLLIQMTVNKNTESLADVEEDIDEIQEDVQETQESIDKIEDDVEDLGEDVDKIQDDSQKDTMPAQTLKHLQTLMIEIAKDIEGLEKDLEKLQEKK